MKKNKILSLFNQDNNYMSLKQEVNLKASKAQILLKNITTSQKAIIASSMISDSKTNHLFIMDNLEDALYFVDDLNNTRSKNKALLFPSSKRIEMGDNNIVLERIDVLKNLVSKRHNVIVTYPEAIKELIVEKKEFKKNQFKLKKYDLVNQDNLIIQLEKMGFESVDSVLEPGDFCAKGFILDIFSYGDEYPCRVIFDNETIEEMSYFKVSSQMAIQETIEFDIVSNIQSSKKETVNATLFSYMPQNTILWISNSNSLMSKVDKTETSIENGNLNIN